MAAPIPNSDVDGALTKLGGWWLYLKQLVYVCGGLDHYVGIDKSSFPLQLFWTGGVLSGPTVQFKGNRLSKFLAMAGRHFSGLKSVRCFLTLRGEAKGYISGFL